MLLHLCNQLVVEHVAFCDGKHASLVGQIGVEAFQLVEQYLIFAADIVGVGRNHEQQHGIALDVAQEPQSETFALACTLDDAGNVGHYKRLRSAISHDAEVWLESRKRIVGNLRLCRRYCRQQG